MGGVRGGGKSVMGPPCSRYPGRTGSPYGGGLLAHADPALTVKGNVGAPAVVIEQMLSYYEIRWRDPRKWHTLVLPVRLGRVIIHQRT